ncbi:MAG: hypothetical protein K8R76_12960 [Candidatus Aegiribacteria sp.]|nr:hypothetical protein [Candidatus Aegiribacteria sp.]
MSIGTGDRRYDLSVSKDVRKILESEAAGFPDRFPGLNIRFCVIMGRRISHITGNTSIIRSEEFRVTITPEIVMLISGSWQNIQDELRNYAQSIAEQIRP